MEKSQQNQVKEDWITISELCRESGLSKVTIYQYIRMGLLPKPNKVGFRSSFYDKSHLRVLGQIRYFREKENLPLIEIKEIIHGEGPSESRESQQAELKRKREQIVDKAIEHFSERGYQETKIEDITDSLGIGKGTFYSYFKNKKELFLECLGRLTLIIIPKERWEEIRKEHDPILRIRKRLQVSLEAYRFFIGNAEILKYAIRSKDEELASKARESWKLLFFPIIKDFRWAVDKKIFRDFDEDVYANFHGAMFEALCYMLEMDPKMSIEQAIDAFVDFICYGVLRPEAGKGSKHEKNNFEYTIRDKKGIETTVNNLRFNGKPYILGKLGAAEIKVDVGKNRSISLKEGPGSSAMLTTEEGQQIEIEMLDAYSVTGECALGQYCVPLEQISKISRH